jgi:formylglycine-generating enzyme required for sulfatase activity
VAALGTPDTGGADNGSTTCNTDNLVPGVALTGSRGGCVSDIGAFDMVGNVWEWVAEWVDRANGCTRWPAGFGSDWSCVGGPGSGHSNLPGPLVRGGPWGDDTGAGVFAVDVDDAPSGGSLSIGFRCAR